MGQTGWVRVAETDQVNESGGDVHSGERQASENQASLRSITTNDRGGVLGVGYALELITSSTPSEREAEWCGVSLLEDTDGRRCIDSSKHLAMHRSW